MEYYKLIETRESVRNYNPNIKVERKILERILNAGRLAPSAANRQPWTFVLVSSDEKLKQVKESYPRDWFADAPHILIVKGDKTKTWIRPYDGYNPIETDLAIAMDHMILAAENEGVATCWIIAYDYDKLAKAIDLKENEVVYCITPLGYPKEGFNKYVNKKRKLLEEVVQWL
jgi:nitroreductase